MIAAYALTAALLASSAGEEIPWREPAQRLLGCWEGEGLGGEVAECWMPGPDGRVTGMFQLVTNGEQNFSEILIIDDFGEGPEMRLKHFHGDLKGWEEKDEFVTFKLKEAREDTLIFGGLTITFEGDDRLLMDLKMKTSAGVQTMNFTYDRTR
ncbi:hypothetical protein HK107_01035 [Parvularcula sp. ZS-1/3]|uniref:DUF6265 domain-containing protein n=1 Tax=Parvularcula mediterranea TaxID=2732508 RepID=A0A7Y3RIW3_9PROT|nr:DUF6265 family protein [Parvularcula mediterranea]NNU14905.1 hypothetical protein [Parvularcula mediterranea]